MKLEIEKPNWDQVTKVIYGGGVTTWISSGLDTWFENHVEPINKMLSEGYEVFSRSNTTYLGDMWSIADNHHMTHKALLINIQPIKKETAEDVLRDFVKSKLTEGPYASWGTGDLCSLHDRAKALLERGE